MMVHGLLRTPMGLIGFAAVGFVTISILPVSYSYGAELTYPVGEAMSVGVMMLSAQFYSIFLIYFGSYLASVHQPYVMWLLQLQLLIPAVVCFFINEDLRRGKINDKNQE